MEISMENVLFDIMFLMVDNQRDAKMKVASDSGPSCSKLG